MSLKHAAEIVSNDGKAVTTVRTLLSWFYAERRGYWIVKRIRRELAQLGLQTSPDFEGIHIDALVELEPIEESDAGTTSEDKPANDEKESASSGRYDDPAYSIGKLDSAVHAPTSVSPDTTVNEAVTIMMANDYSQLPVMNGDYTVKGMFSWKQLGVHSTAGHKCEFVRECMGPFEVIRSDESIFKALPIVAENDCVLVKSVDDGKITGIVTASDFASQFGQMGEPFLLLGEIENHVRRLLDGRVGKEELESVKDPNDSDREINEVSDLTFGEYVRLIENPESWEKLAIPLDRSVVSRLLDEVRQIRNDVMHFDPDGPSDKNLDILRQTRRFLDSVGNLIHGQELEQ